MFKSAHKSFKSKAKKSMTDMYLVFVQQKNLMEKNPENLMRAMGYFEFFYLDQLDKKKKAIKGFKEKYPNIPYYIKKDIKSLFSLNQAKKSMRESMGLTLDDNPEKALEYYMAMYNFLSKAEKITNKLTPTEARLKKESAKFKKHFGLFKKTIKLRSEKRIDQKTFNKYLKKNIKDTKNSLKKLSVIDPKTDKLYQIVATIFEKSLKVVDNCSENCDRKDLLLVLDSVDFTNSILADAEKNIIKKKYTQNMETLDIENFSEDQKLIIASVSNNMKQQKINKNKNLQNSVLNLGNNNFPIDEYLDKINEEGFEVQSITMSFDEVDNMKRWVMKDWANSWRGELPSEIKDSDGNLIKFSQENLNDIKAQLAINTFSSMIDTSSLELKDTISQNIKEISETIEASGGFDINAWLNQDFTITLDNYSQLVGNSLGIEINDFKDMTRVANEWYGSNMSTEDYADHWKSSQFYESTSSWGAVTMGVDLIDQVGSFEAASIAAELGTDLQTVADSISQAAAVGVSTDLETAAQGLGFGSFSDAVAAYNAQYGTNYTVDSAKEALGQ